MKKVINLNETRAELDGRLTDQHAAWLRDGIDRLHKLEVESRNLRFALEHSLRGLLGGTP
jgi:hypothetical protein